MTDDTAEWDAIVLAGGRSRRLGGIDKTSLVFEGSSLLDRAVSGVAGARRIVVVGPSELRSRLADHVQLVAEHPRFGGPAAATAAGLAALSDPAPRVVVIAADLPFAAEAVAQLLAVGRLAACADGVVAADSTGRLQPLLAVYATHTLAGAIDAAGELENASMRALTRGMLLCQVRLPDELCADIDTPRAAEQHGIALGRTLAHA